MRLHNSLRYRSITDDDDIRFLQDLLGHSKQKYRS